MVKRCELNLVLENTEKVVIMYIKASETGREFYENLQNSETTLTDCTANRIARQLQIAIFEYHKSFFEMPRRFKNHILCNMISTVSYNTMTLDRLVGLQ